MVRRKKISQLTARRLQKRVAELELYHHNLYTAGVGINVWNLSGQTDMTKRVLENTRMLGFNLRARLNGNTLELYAVK